MCVCMVTICFCIANSCCRIMEFMSMGTSCMLLPSAPPPRKLFPSMLPPIVQPPCNACCALPPSMLPAIMLPPSMPPATTLLERTKEPEEVLESLLSVLLFGTNLSSRWTFNKNDAFGAGGLTWPNAAEKRSGRKDCRALGSPGSLSK
jgi:hypothetical protein